MHRNKTTISRVNLPAPKMVRDMDLDWSEILGTPATPTAHGYFPTSQLRRCNVCKKRSIGMKHVPCQHFRMFFQHGTCNIRSDFSYAWRAELWTHPITWHHMSGTFFWHVLEPVFASAKKILHPFVSLMQFWAVALRLFQLQLEQRAAFHGNVFLYGEKHTNLLHPRGKKNHQKKGALWKRRGLDQTGVACIIINSVFSYFLHDDALFSHFFRIYLLFYNVFFVSLF